MTLGNLYYDFHVFWQAILLASSADIVDIV